MKKLFFTLGAILTFGMASAQINGQNTAGQLNNNNSAATTMQDMKMTRNSNAQPQSGIIPSSNNIATPSTAPAASGMSTTGLSGSGQGTQTSGGVGSGSGSTVTTTGTPNTTNTTNATTTGKPKL
jgi:hypothetical protein